MASGKFVLRTDTKQHHVLQKSAEKMSQSLNERCVQLISVGMCCENEVSREFAPFLIQLKDKYKDGLIGAVGFGSSIRGDYFASSDFDLALIFDNSIEIKRKLYSVLEPQLEEFNATLARSVEVSCVHLPQTPSGLWAELATDGLVLMDPKRRIEQSLRWMRHKIAAGEISRRSGPHGQGYWLIGTEKLYA